jgi:hypothetical protein
VRGIECQTGGPHYHRGGTGLVAETGARYGVEHRSGLVRPLSTHAEALAVPRAGLARSIVPESFSGHLRKTFRPTTS